MGKSRFDILKQVYVDRAYVVFLIWQCEACLVAIDRGRIGSDAARRRADVIQNASFVDHQQVFSDFQSALTFAGNISKMIWPVAKALRRHEVKAGLARGRRIRKVLGIRARDRVLFNSPTIRNNFEHLAERVDVWAQGTTGGPLGIHVLADDSHLTHVAKQDRFTRYDPGADTLSMLDDKISLKKLESTVRDVWQACALAYQGIVRFEKQLQAQEKPK